jgi:hypothetical protein
VVIGLSAEVKGQMERWLGAEPDDDDGILPEEVREAAKNPFKEPDPSKPDSELELSPEEMKQVAELAARDAEVRAHENAHVSAAGGLAGSPSFSYQVGPDGKRYAIGGSVKIDMSKESTPEQTLAKAERVRAAAMAPSEPSPQDASIASKASQMASDARAQIAAEKRDDIVEETSRAEGAEKSPWTGSGTSSDETPNPGSELDALA